METIFFNIPGNENPAVYLETGPIAATVGFFDGVHLGHRFLIEQLKSIAGKKGLPSAVITFPVHPRKVLDQQYCPQLLTGFEEKLRHLADTGIDYCLVTDFSEVLSQLTAKSFIQGLLAEKLQVKELVAGYDHRFGKDRSEGIDAYTIYGQEAGIGVNSAEPLKIDGDYVSSTRIRKLLLSGDVQAADRLLSYDYRLEGTVVSGNRLGRSIGFPTANVKLEEPEKLVPANGIYTARVYVGTDTYKGMLYIGPRPTIISKGEIRIEVHLLDFSGNLYGQMISVELTNFLRKDKKFKTTEALRMQLIDDKKRMLELI